MNKQEAATYLKEVLTSCNLTSDSFILVEPNPTDTLSKGYKIRIIASMNKACREQVKTITKKHDLAVIEEQNPNYSLQTKINSPRHNIEISIQSTIIQVVYHQLHFKVF